MHDNGQSPERSLLRSYLASHSRARRLDDRIRSLCHQALHSSDPEESNRVLAQLSAALHDHIERFRQGAINGLFQKERRRL